MPATDIQNPEQPTPTPDTSTPAEALSRNWHAVLVVEGVRTSDRREFKAGSLRWRALPLPLMMQLQSADKHQGSVVVGRIERIERIDDEIHGWGTFDLGSENGREAQRLVNEQILRGVSIDAELLEIDREQLLAEDDGEIALVVEEARIGAATIVHFPAFPQAVIALADSTIPDSTEDGRGEATSTFKPLSDQDKAICLDECGDDQNCVEDCMRKKAHMSEEVPIPNLPPHHESDGTLSLDGLTAAATRFNQVNAPLSVLSRARSHLRDHYRELHKDPPKSLMQLALVAHAEQQGPPADWFADPELKGPTPLTVARNGRVYGHLVHDWNACHIGYQNECMKPPHSRTNYAHFLLGSTFPSDCDCDGALATGPIVLGTSHANAYAAASAARTHYDNTGLAVADVVVGEDSFGIWVAGALRPGVSDAQIRALRGSTLSGDWRHIGGNMELISILAVNTPGFPVPRITAGIEGGVQVSLVAAGIPQESNGTEVVPGESDPATLLEELKREREQQNGDDTEKPAENGDGDDTSTPNTSESESEEPTDDPAVDSDAPSPAETPPTPTESASSLLSALRASTSPTA